MRKTHNQKVREARRMITLEETKAGVPIFSSMNWLQRKRATIMRTMKERREAAKRKGYIEITRPAPPVPPKVVPVRRSIWQRLFGWLSQALGF